MLKVCQYKRERLNRTQIQKTFSLSDIETILADLGVGYTVSGSMTGTRFKGLADIKSATEHELSFCSSTGVEAIRYISESKAGAIFCKKQDIEAFLDLNERKSHQTLVFVDNPRLAFIHATKRIYGDGSCRRKKIGISSKAMVSETSEIGKDCYVGNFSVIEDNCSIGDNVIIYDRVSILENTKVGNNCIIQPGTVIGADGFAYERYENTLELERFPHMGGIMIQDNVEICSNCSIARGTINDTVIGYGTKLDALVHVAHNVTIGANTVITAGVVIGGSTTVGDTCWLGLNSTLKNKIKIGRQVIVGSGASVIHDIADEDIVAGVPAKSIKNKVTCDKLFMMAGQGSLDKRTAPVIV
jgi:UDP-3-O-[3-hydroxymyristoyl] glucosamine N-acyltransferase